MEASLQAYHDTGEPLSAWTAGILALSKDHPHESAGQVHRGKPAEDASWQADRDALPTGKTSGKARLSAVPDSVLQDRVKTKRTFLHLEGEAAGQAKQARRTSSAPPATRRWACKGCGRQTQAITNYIQWLQDNKIDWTTEDVYCEDCTRKMNKSRAADERQPENASDSAGGPQAHQSSWRPTQSGEDVTDVEDEAEDIANLDGEPEEISSEEDYAPARPWTDADYKRHSAQTLLLKPKPKQTPSHDGAKVQQSMDKAAEILIARGTRIIGGTASTADTRKGTQSSTYKRPMGHGVSQQRKELCSDRQKRRY